jgi:hypothetical protein
MVMNDIMYICLHKNERIRKGHSVLIVDQQNQPVQQAGVAIAGASYEYTGKNSWKRPKNFKRR